MGIYWWRESTSVVNVIELKYSFTLLVVSEESFVEILRIFTWTQHLNTYFTFQLKQGPLEGMGRINKSYQGLSVLILSPLESPNINWIEQVRKWNHDQGPWVIFPFLLSGYWPTPSSIRIGSRED